MSKQRKRRKSMGDGQRLMKHEVFIDNAFFSLFCDSIEHAVLSKTLQGHPETKLRLGRASILSTALALECAANACFGVVNFSKELLKHLEQKLQTLDKFELVALASDPSRKFDRGAHVVQKMGDLLQLCNDYVHPKLIEYKIDRQSDSKIQVICGKYEHLNLTKSWRLWNDEAAVIVLRALVEFLNYFFDTCGWGPEHTTQILMTRLKRSESFIFFNDGHEANSAFRLKEVLGVDAKFVDRATLEHRGSLKNKMGQNEIGIVARSHPLGASGLQVAPLALGGNVFGWTIDQATSFHILDAFVDAGFNLVDTADVYSRWAPGNQGGESETILGNWLKQGGKRDKVVLATKVGMDMGEGRVGLSKAHILRSVDESLARLQTDRIDLYQAHKDDPNIPLEETLGAFAELVRAGKVRAIGASNYSAARLAEALEVSRSNDLPAYVCLQPHYNLAERAIFEDELEPLCRSADIAVIPYYSLASGFLTGKYRSEADLAQGPRGQGVKKYLNEHGMKILAALDEVASRHSSTPARVALAWLAARPLVTAPIASATRLDQLDDLIASTRLTLGPADVALLDHASA